MKRTCTIVLALSVAALVAACAAGDLKTDQALDQQALALWPMSTTSTLAQQEITEGMRENDMDRGIEAYERAKRAIAADSTSVSAYILAANTAQSPAEAIAALKRAIALAPRGNESEKLLAEVTDKYALRRDLDGGRAVAERLVALDPKSPRSWMLLAEIDSVAGNTSLSRAEIDKAIEVAPNFAPAYIMSSASWAMSTPRDLVRAEKDARTAVELQPTEALPQDVLGDALRLQGKLDDAAVAYTKMAELDPTHGAGYQQRGHVNTFLGKFAEARADYTAGAAAQPGNAKVGFMLYVPFVALHENKRRQAYDELEKIYNQIDGLNVPAPTAARILVAENEKAVAVYEHMIPELETAVARLKVLRQQLVSEIGNLEEAVRNANADDVLDEGYVAFVKKQYDAARNSAARYMKIREPDRNPTKNWAAHRLIGLVDLDQHRYADAVKQFDQSDPNDIYNKYLRARATEADGKIDEARTQYKYISTYYFNPIGLALIRSDVLARVAAIPAGK